MKVRYLYIIDDLKRRKIINILELNQTKKVEAGATGYHFVCFMQRGDEVVEFDGCKPTLTHHAKIGEVC